MKLEACLADTNARMSKTMRLLKILVFHLLKLILITYVTSHLSEVFIWQFYICKLIETISIR